MDPWPRQLALLLPRQHRWVLMQYYNNRCVLQPSYIDTRHVFLMCKCERKLYFRPYAGGLTKPMASSRLARNQVNCTFPSINDELVVDVKPGGIIGPQVQRECLAGRRQQLALPPGRHVVSPVWRNGPSPPVEFDLLNRIFARQTVW